MPSYDNILSDISGGLYATHTPTLPPQHPQLRPTHSPEEGDLDAAAGQRISELVRRIVRAELYRSAAETAALEEELSLDTLAAVVAAMDELRPDHGGFQDIDDLDAFAAIEARRAVGDWWRHAHPGLHRLRMRVRYVLTADRKFGIWPNMHGDGVCGLARWRMERRSTVSDVSGVIAGVAADLGPEATLEAIFEKLAAPVFFNDLVALCARLWSVQDTAQPRRREPLLPAGHRAEDLRRIWAVTRGLASRQRAVMILGSTTPDRRSGAALLMQMGAATPRELATALHLPAEDFLALLPRLPLADAETASLLRLNERQVVHLRRYARERLRRQIAA